jgi:hypothetical protein
VEFRPEFRAETRPQGEKGFNYTFTP